MKRFPCAVFTIFAVVPLVAAAPARPGKVQWSNGEIIEGRLSLTPGEELKIHLPNQSIRALTLDRVREIRMVPEGDQMVQKWRFLEAGQTKKEMSGKPYPIRNLKTTITLAGGEKIIGHLYTTVLYIETDEKAQKVILWAKQRGKEGESLNDLRYPALIRFTDAATETDDRIRLQVRWPGLDAKSEVAGLTVGALLQLEAKRSGAVGEFKMPSPLGQEMFLAIQTGPQIVVGWPPEREAKFTELVRTNLALAKDFFDEQKLLAVWFDKPASDIYSLLMLTRKGKTTLDADKSQPWRLVVLRWKYDEETQRVMLSGRGYFFRGILGGTDVPPSVEVTDKLWPVTKRGEVWAAGPPE
jgi:hypothetical protein